MYVMQDKYSKLEGKIEEGIRRTGVIEKSMESFLGLLSWENVGVRNEKGGLRLNIVEIKPKSSSVRFVVNQKVNEWISYFENNFLDNNGQKEKIVFRVR